MFKKNVVSFVILLLSLCLHLLFVAGALFGHLLGRASQSEEKLPPQKVIQIKLPDLSKVNDKKVNVSTSAGTIPPTVTSKPETKKLSVPVTKTTEPHSLQTTPQQTKTQKIKTTTQEKDIHQRVDHKPQALPDEKKDSSEESDHTVKPNPQNQEQVAKIDINKVQIEKKEDDDKLNSQHSLSAAQVTNKEDAVSKPEASNVTNNANTPEADVLPSKLSLPDDAEVQYIRVPADKDDQMTGGQGQGRYTFTRSGQQYTSTLVLQTDLLTIRAQSKGHFGKTGIAPDHFEFEQNKKHLVTSFDYTNKTVKIGDKEPDKIEDGVQDLLSLWMQLGVILQGVDIQKNQSFPVQFAFKNLKVRNVVIKDINVSLDGGMHGLVHLSVPQDSNSTIKSIELWLSPEHQYLPVQIMFKVEKSIGIARLEIPVKFKANFLPPVTNSVISRDS